MKKLLFCLLPFFCLAQSKQVTFSLEIMLDKDFPEYVYLAYEDKIDSSQAINKMLSFKGRVEKEICLAGFMLADNKYFRLSKPLYLENSNIVIVADVVKKKVRINDTLTTFEVKSITGSKTNTIYEGIDGFRKNHKSDSDYPQKFLEKADAIVTENPKNPLAGELLYDLIGDKSYDKELLKKIYFKIDRSFQDEFPIHKVENYLFPESFVKTNGKMFHFSLPDKQNKLFNTETLKGKWIFLDFWASWCGPCREQFPELKRIYETYKNKNFEIVSVSIDKKQPRWLEALGEENPQWINVIEEQDTSGPIARKYDLLGVPHNYLIDPEGKIIANNMQLEQLEKVLQGL